MIVLTAPTSQIGRQLVDNLVDGEEPLRLVARDPDRIPGAVRRRVDVVRGSHGDPEVVDKAFAGADAIFWLYPTDPQAPDARAHMLDFHRGACEAITRHRVPHVVSIAALGRGVTDRAGLVSLSLEKDDLLAATGAHLRALALPGFMDNVLRQVGSIVEHGVLADTADPDHAHPMVATRDIAAAAAGLLTDRSWTGVGSRAVLGPHDLSARQMATIVTEVLGTTVRYRQVPAEDYRRQLLAGGFSESVADAMMEMFEAKDHRGLDTAEPRTPESTSPTSFRTWCHEVLEPAIAPRTAE